MKLTFSEKLKFALLAMMPSHWLRNEPTDRYLTKWINDQLDSGALPEVIGPFTAKLSGQLIWIANYPYCYGHLYGPMSRASGVMTFSSVRGLPNRRTVVRLRDAVFKASCPLGGE